MRTVNWALLMLLSLPAMASDTETELQRLYSALSMLNQEQQAVYQQFQMVQELRRSFPMGLYGAQMLPITRGELPNYDEVFEAQQNAIRRSENLHTRADQLLARYNDIEEMKRPLQQQILELTLSNKASAPTQPK